MLFISAQVPDNLGRIGSNTYAGQTISVLMQLDEQLREAGCSKDNLIRVQVFLRDQPYGAKAFYEQWESWVEPTCLPVLPPSPRLPSRPMFIPSSPRLKELFPFSFNQKYMYKPRMEENVSFSLKL